MDKLRMGLPGYDGAEYRPQVELLFFQFLLHKKLRGTANPLAVPLK